VVLSLTKHSRRGDGLAPVLPEGSAQGERKTEPALANVGVRTNHRLPGRGACCPAPSSPAPESGISELERELEEWTEADGDFELRYRVQRLLAALAEDDP
jgi:hypothetical protein